MKPNFTQLEFMNELFTPHAQTFPFLNDVMEKHKDKKFHFIIGGTVGLSLDDIRITDKNGNTVEDVVWEPINPKKSSDYVLSEKESGIYSLYSSNNIFISTKSAYCPYDYTISLKLDSIKTWFYFCISLSGAEDNNIFPNQKQQNKRAIMLVVPEKRSTRISFWNNDNEKEWVVKRSDFDWSTHHSFGIGKTENDSWTFLLDGAAVSDMGNELKPHSHHCYELSYIHSGSGYMTIDGKEYFLDEDTFVLIKPNSIHSFKGSDACRLFYVGFYYDNSCEILNQTFSEKSSEISKIIMQLDQELKQTPHKFEDVVQGYQMLILFTLIRMQKKLFPNDEKTSVFHNVVSEIKKSFTRKIDTKKLSAATGYSYHHFRHLFKNQLGMTVNQYITELRLHHAMQLLRTTDMSIKKISYSNGFSTVNAFTDAIKKIYDLTPSNYRNAEESFMEVFSPIGKESNLCQYN